MVTRKGKPLVAGAMTRRRVYNFIVYYKMTNDGVAPSIEEIADELDISKSHANHAINVLCNMGVLKRGAFISRHLQVVGGKWAPPKEAYTE